MRKNTPTTNKERTFQVQQRLISATDTAGNITYCNNDFADISGFTREELIGQPHNLVRHPDVPPPIYQHMWSCLKKGLPWMGIVKNRCKNGDFYWVNAYVSPIFEHGQLAGYESVRTVPSADEVKRASRIYQSFWKRKSAGLAPEWVHKAIDVAVISVPAFIGAVLHGVLDGPLGIAATIVFTLLAGLAGSLWHYHKLGPAMKRAQRAISYPVIAAMYTDSRGIHSRIEMAQISLEARIRTAMNRVHDGTANLQQQSEESDQVAESNRALANEQYEETQQLSASTHQLTQATHEIAQNIQQAAEATEEADSLSHHGRTLSTKAQQEMEALGSAMVQVKATVTKLTGHIDEIGTVLDMISEIAEQTNLLALNAAIEAARAGEHGRGFSVVADEVRNLATRSQESTKRIHTLIDSLQEAATETVDVMDSSSTRLESSVTSVQEAQNALEGIASAVNAITAMTQQVASAAEEQTQVSDEISQRLNGLAASADSATQAADSSQHISQALRKAVQDQERLVARFLIDK